MDTLALIFIFHTVSIFIFIYTDLFQYKANLITIANSTKALLTSVINMLSTKNEYGLITILLIALGMKINTIDLTETDLQLPKKSFWLVSCYQNIYNSLSANCILKTYNSIGFTISTIYKNFVTALKAFFSFKFLRVCINPLLIMLESEINSEQLTELSKGSLGTFKLHNDRSPTILKVFFNRKSERLIKLKIYKLSVKIAKERNTVVLPTILEEDLLDIFN